MAPWTSTVCTNSHPVVFGEVTHTWYTPALMNSMDASYWRSRYGTAWPPGVHGSPERIQPPPMSISNGQVPLSTKHQPLGPVPVLDHAAQNPPTLPTARPLHLQLSRRGSRTHSIMYRTDGDVRGPLLWVSTGRPPTSSLDPSSTHPSSLIRTCASYGQRMGTQRLTVCPVNAWAGFCNTTGSGLRACGSLTVSSTRLDGAHLGPKGGNRGNVEVAASME
mmetsp:Transcript_90776/g.157431  ORF Transcript_90776/g.157431 Transcript_90776/m.157431 type:complete len:220 (+) Transcript_90776:492-1151(+)